ncbi:hypothetical protein AN641_06595 [Candidatus Epulonipiscioides gigas]|nr:hypothetical protein AN641_06595 [Epulopiscium sp. SCG-C07WGA-EpuloA2]
MKINYNIPALNIVNILSKNNLTLTSSMEKLSSGLKIGKSKDDPAGMAISLKMRAQIDSLEQANKNSTDAIALIQTAEGALDSSHAITKRMRELAIQSGNDTLTDLDREKIQTEVDELIKELDRISSDTEFNQHRVLSGENNLKDSGFNITQTTMDGGLQAQYELELGTVISNDYLDIDGVSFIFYDSAAGDPNPEIYGAKGLDLSGDWKKDLAAAGLPNFDVDPTKEPLLITAKEAGRTGNVDPTFFMITSSLDTTLTQVTLGMDDSEYAEYEVIIPETLPYEAGSGFTIDGTVFEFYDPAQTETGDYEGTGVGIPIYQYTKGTPPIVDTALQTTTTELTQILNAQSFDNFHLDTTTTGAIGDPFILRSNVAGVAGNYLAGYDGGTTASKLTIQTGSEANQLTKMEIATATTDALGLTSKTSLYGFTDYIVLEDNATTSEYNEARYGISLLTVEDASFALGAIDKAVGIISSQRAYLGSNQNRLEYTVKNLDISSENLSSAMSRIRDVDMAKEMALYTKDNILNQAATSMLAQANQRPQQVFQLLQG